MTREHLWDPAFALALIIIAAFAAGCTVRALIAAERTDRRRGGPFWAWIAVMSFGSAMLFLLT